MIWPISCAASSVKSWKPRRVAILSRMTFIASAMKGPSAIAVLATASTRLIVAPNIRRGLRVGEWRALGDAAFPRIRAQRQIEKAKLRVSRLFDLLFRVEGIAIDAIDVEIARIHPDFRQDLGIDDRAEPALHNVRHWLVERHGVPLRETRIDPARPMRKLALYPSRIVVLGELKVSRGQLGQVGERIEGEVAHAKILRRRAQGDPHARRAGSVRLAAEEEVGMSRSHCVAALENPLEFALARELRIQHAVMRDHVEGLAINVSERAQLIARDLLSDEVVGVIRPALVVAAELRREDRSTEAESRDEILRVVRAARGAREEERAGQLNSTRVERRRHEDPAHSEVARDPRASGALHACCSADQ